MSSQRFILCMKLETRGREVVENEKRKPPIKILCTDRVNSTPILEIKVDENARGKLGIVAEKDSKLPLPLRMGVFITDGDNKITKEELVQPKP